MRVLKPGVLPASGLLSRKAAASGPGYHGHLALLRDKAMNMVLLMEEILHHLEP